MKIYNIIKTYFEKGEVIAATAEVIDAKLTYEDAVVRMNEFFLENRTQVKCFDRVTDAIIKFWEEKTIEQNGVQITLTIGGYISVEAVVVEDIYQHERAYTDMSLRSFMNSVSFIVASAGVYLGGLISNFNYEKTLPGLKFKSDIELKRCFIEKVKKLAKAEKISLKIDENSPIPDYYEIWYVKKS